MPPYRDGTVSILLAKLAYGGGAVFCNRASQKAWRAVLRAYDDGGGSIFLRSWLQGSGPAVQARLQKREGRMRPYAAGVVNILC